MCANLLSHLSRTSHLGTRLNVVLSVMNNKFNVIFLVPFQENDGRKICFYCRFLGCPCLRCVETTPRSMEDLENGGEDRRFIEILFLARFGHFSIESQRIGGGKFKNIRCQQYVETETSIQLICSICYGSKRLVNDFHNISAITVSSVVYDHACGYIKNASSYLKILDCLFA